MRDVAALAGVGIKTVSRVINGEPNVSAELATRVNQAAEKLNFRPDLIAGNLRRADRRSHSIGLILASVDNPFSASIHRAIEDVAESIGVAVFSASTDDNPSRERRLVAAFVSRRVDGLVIAPSGASQHYLAAEIESGTPVVMIDRPAAGVHTDSVATPHQLSAATATEHLIAGGHRRIAVLADLTTIQTAAQRLEGYRSALARAGLDIDPELICDDLHDEDLAYAATMRLLELSRPPTAVFASQNLLAIGALRALHAANRHHDIALVGFDDFPLADLLEPAVTVIAQDPFAIGREAAQLLFARMNDPHRPIQSTLIPARLITRGSGEIPPRP